VKTILFIALASLTSSISLGQGQVLNKTLTDNGVERSYIVYVPSGYSAEHPVPLVLAFHGLHGTAEQMMVTTGMSAVAEDETFLVAYPDGNRNWARSNDHNVGFVDSLLKAIESDYSVDASRIYATGMSQGGMMSYILGVSRPNRFAAIASVGGTRPGKNLEDLFPASIKSIPGHQLPLLHMHGTADDIIPYHGGTVVVPGAGELTFPSTPLVVASWAGNNGCGGLGQEKKLKDFSKDDGSGGSSSTVSVFNYGDCATYTGVSGREIPAEVVLYRINGGGHFWPVLAENREESLEALEKALRASLGDKLDAEGEAVINCDISASAEIWAFFKKHELSASAAGGRIDVSK
jgi:polyhydroxybutyrate depolymerase